MIAKRIGILKRYRDLDDDLLPGPSESNPTVINLKRMRRVQFPELDTVLYDWFLSFKR